MNARLHGRLAGGLLLAAALLPPDPAAAAEARAETGTTTATGAATERQVYFGDLHLHTSMSTDAIFLGANPVGLDEAYRFARGEEVEWRGQRFRRDWPLDFIAVTDHAEQMGIGRLLFDPAGPLAKTELSQKLRSGKPLAPAELGPLFRSKQPIPGVDVSPLVAEAWEAQRSAAKRHERPGVFTTFLAYEWSSAPEMQNLHRNVIFRGTDAPLPFSSADSLRPEDLWTYLEENRARGVEALAIPHNADVSNGLMYAVTDSDGKPIDARHARRRAENEPLSEIYQSKGQSETHPELSPKDDFARFELFELMLGTRIRSKTSGGYVREALGRGLAIARETGENPYSFGFVGATDLHTGLSDARESTYRGPGDYGKLTREVAEQLLGQREVENFVIPEVSSGSGGLTGIWAEENTRESLYDALRRKETFATSGPRISLRVFGGWKLAPDLFGDVRWAATAYESGVPMGGTLPAAPKEAGAPRLAIQAQMDPGSAKLERIQVVKISLDRSGPAERIFDVKVVAEGAASLMGVWADPEFTLAHPALYYVRVLEIATPRWSTLLAREHGLEPAKDVATTVQERAWSSPIAYAPPTAERARAIIPPSRETR